MTTVEEDQAALEALLLRHFDRLMRDKAKGGLQGWQPTAVVVAGPASLFYGGGSPGTMLGLPVVLGDTIEGPEIQWDRYTVWPVPAGVRVA